MKLHNLREKNELVLVVLLVISLSSAVLTLVKIKGFFTASARAENLVKRAVEQNNMNTKETDRYLAQYKVLADALKKNNLFAPPVPKQHPVKEVLGILGDEVLIKDKWYKIGDMIENAKITSIGPTMVKIEWEGSEKAFAPILDSASDDPEMLSRNSRTKRTTRNQNRTGKATMVVVGSEGSRAENTERFANPSKKEMVKLESKALQKQKLQAEKEKSRKQPMNNKEKAPTKQKKDMTQKTKRNIDIKPEKEAAQRKIRK